MDTFVRYISGLSLFFMISNAFGQAVYMTPSLSGSMSFTMNTNGVLVAGSYVPPAGCRADVNLSRVGEEIVLKATAYCAAKGLEGNWADMMPTLHLFDGQDEVKVLVDKDYFYRARLPAKLNYAGESVYVVLVPTSTKLYDFSRMACQTYGAPKSTIGQIPSSSLSASSLSHFTLSSTTTILQ